ncbi:ALP1-like protein [Tanacetum coccineum]
MSDSTGGMNDLDDMEDMEMIMQQLRYEQSLQEQEAESLNRRNYIYRERDIAEERLMADYFGIETYIQTVDPLPPHFDFFRVRPDATGQPRVAGAINDITVFNNSPLFDDLLDDITRVAPFEVNGVIFQQGYYLADGIYPQ